MFSGFGWFGKRRVAPGTTDQPVLIADPSVPLPPALMAALEGRFGGLQILRPGADLPLEPTAAWARIRRLRPRLLVVVGTFGLPADLWRTMEVPVYWINAHGPEAQYARQCCVRSPRDVDGLPGATVTGDPLLGLDTLPERPTDTGFCARFQEIRERQRWVLYFPESEAPEEDLAYHTFLRLSRKGVGLLVLAPADAARHETVYRDAMRFHLLTNRHRRLMTSYVPHQTRVYYIEDAPALAQMYGCADVVVAGGSFAAAPTREPDLLRPLALGCPVVVGPKGATLLQRAAIADGAVVLADPGEILEQRLAGLLLDAGERARQGAWGRAWLEHQCGALARVLGCVAHW